MAIAGTPPRRPAVASTWSSSATGVNSCSSPSDETIEYNANANSPARPSSVLSMPRSPVDEVLHSDPRLYGSGGFRQLNLPTRPRKRGRPPHYVGRRVEPPHPAPQAGPTSPLRGEAS